MESTKKSVVWAIPLAAVFGGILGFGSGYQWGSESAVNDAQALTWWDSGPEQTFEGKIQDLYIADPTDILLELKARRKDGTNQVSCDRGPGGYIFCNVTNDLGAMYMSNDTRYYGKDPYLVDGEKIWEDPKLQIGTRVRVIYVELSESIKFRGSMKNRNPGEMRKMIWVQRIEPIE